VSNLWQEPLVFQDESVLIVRLDESERTEVGVEGEVDLQSSPVLRRALQGHRSEVRIDLAGATFLDAAAIRVLVDVSEAARRQGGRCCVVGLDRFHRRLFNHLGLEHLDVEPADEA
jgi:anti-anti-sigma factor